MWNDFEFIVQSGMNKACGWDNWGSLFIECLSLNVHSNNLYHIDKWIKTGFSNSLNPFNYYNRYGHDSFLTLLFPRISFPISSSLISSYVILWWKCKYSVQSLHARIDRMCIKVILCKSIENWDALVTSWFIWNICFQGNLLAECC